MKRYYPSILIVLICSVFFFTSCNQGGKKQVNTNVEASNSADTAKIYFAEYEHDFGKIKDGENVAYVFTFENRGKAPLVIQSASTSCGCTVSKYETKPVAPGDGDSGGCLPFNGIQGAQTKSVTVKSNASVPFVMLKIKQK
ncbi:MAG: DUF1573 domain-containing protein [Bacteroidales bacterium]